jgi:calmodulin
MDEEELRENFDYFDANGDGKLDLREFTGLMKALDALEPGESATLGFRAIDSDALGRRWACCSGCWRLLSPDRLTPTMSS